MRSDPPSGSDGSGEEEYTTEDEREEVEGPTDEEQVESEWHVWLLGTLFFIGIALVFAGPELIPYLGPALVAVAVFGWVFKEWIERSMG